MCKVGNFKNRRPPNDSGVPRKIYVCSGELRWVGIAVGCLDAVKKALEKYGSGKTLDGSYFFLSECGFRTDDAEYRVSINKGLRHAGYVFDNPSDAID